MESYSSLYNIYKSQNELRLQNIECDVIFEIGAKSFPAHRFILAARVEHFRNMFTTDMEEQKGLTVQFDPLIIHPDFFEEILVFIYTSNIEFTNENIRAIYMAADDFCFEELMDLVEYHMGDTIDIENAILYRSICAEFDLDHLKDKFEEFIIDNVSFDIIKSQLIPTLSLEELQSFIGIENSKLENMFHYCIEWILHDETNRTGMLFDLLKNFPLKWLSYRFIKETVSKLEIVLNDTDCLKLLFDTLLIISEPLYSLDSFDKNESQSESIYVIGGYDRENSSTISEYNRETHEWVSTTPMLSPLSDFGCAVVGNKVYVCGGDNDKQSSQWNSLTAFDTLTREWTQLTPMKHPRQDCAAAVLNGQIYVAGGWYDPYSARYRRFSGEVERYCVETDQWEDVAHMITKRYSHELVALNGSLYAIGGCLEEGYSDEEPNIVERYNPRTDQWKRMSSPNNEYISFSSAVWSGKIYILETSRTLDQCFCEVYSPADDKWTQIPAPSEYELGRRLAVYNGKLYAIGGRVPGTGYQRMKNSKTVEFFDFQSRVWRLEPDMDIKREYCQIAVVKNSIN